MASSTRPSFSTGASFPMADGVPETEKTSKETDNTYILRPIFQQRRVADGLRQGRPASALAQAGRARLETWASGRLQGAAEDRPATAVFMLLERLRLAAVGMVGSWRLILLYIYLLIDNSHFFFLEMGFDRYKMVVQVMIGEQRGEGVFMAARCFWDADTDNYIHDVFMNDSLFCVVAAFGCFYY
ncbi:PREDICTED: tctex1 domain-containing protein 2 [Hipposideros armiger]|uniref:Tctex1 domain-containing protein 2 n=1 Tax=Hipposideros armiger TaxID=186990 RepID=A0A8B7RZ75_HIPAR|nr:PREDICTED: tctex1 domain-containing protein 2 [Hipposideros armiger]